MSQYFSDLLQEFQLRAETSPQAFRRHALEIFRSYGMPRRKQDPWKYVDNSPLLNLPTEGESAQQELPKKNPTPSSTLPHKTICFVGEALAQDQLDNSSDSYSIRALDFGSDLESGKVAAEDWYLDEGSLKNEENSYSLINAFSFTQAYEICLEPSPHQPKCLRYLHLNFYGTEVYQAPRLYIRIPPGRELAVLVDSRELGANVYWNPYFHFDLGADSRLTLLDRGPNLSSRQSGGSLRTVTLRSDIAAGASFDSALFYWGCRLAVHDSRLAIYGENAEARSRGICFAEGSSAYHLRSENQHLAPSSKSLSLYKNVLFDKASSEFYGIIHAANEGIDTDAVQNNQNLLLSQEARAIARPQLEILVDDLKCSHSSSTGSIDAEELFYMRARGLYQEEAMRLAVVGFVEEISTCFAPDLLDKLGIEDCLQALLSQRDPSQIPNNTVAE